MGGEAAGERRDVLGKALTKAVARVERRVEAVRGDLARAESADEMGRRAQLFVAEAGRAPRGATRLVAVDWSSGEAREVELKLDPARGAREQIDAMFRRARRLKEGARIAGARLEDAERALSTLQAIAAELARQEPPDLDALEIRARAAAPRDFKLASAARSRSRGRGGPQPPLPPYRVFIGGSGTRLLVGRGAEKNDALTFHIARPHDLWLHAKNRTGAHVIVPLDKGASCPADALVEAAHLAAHFSEARDERVVEVQYTPRRYLRKPRGSPPGLVVVDREKVLVLRREDDLLRRLLEREEEPGRDR
jgi:predicted ribosome quality control (RQC) complex YloA/Tae2 family protein